MANSISGTRAAQHWQHVPIEGPPIVGHSRYRATVIRSSCAASFLALTSLAFSPSALAANLDPSQFRTPEFYASGALSLIKAEYAYARGYTGKGVVVAMIDSGLYVQHPEFANRVSPLRYNFGSSQRPDDVSDLNAAGQYDGHGTHVAGIVAAARDGMKMHGVAYNATVLPLRTQFETDTADLAAIDYAIRSGAKVLNGSYGPDAAPPAEIEDDYGNKRPNPYFDPNNLPPFQLVHPEAAVQSYAALKRADQADIVMVFAAGNDFRAYKKQAAHPSGYGMYHLINPAYMQHTPDPIFRFLDASRTTNEYDPSTWAYVDFNDPRVSSLDFSDLAGSMISVAAVGPLGGIAAYSNRCGVVALWCLAAPGGDVVYGGPESDGIWSTHPDPAKGYYAYEDGTSMAAPVVAGAAAVLREAFPYMTARQIIEIMLTTTNSGGIYADSSVYGRGLLDLGRAIEGPAEFGAEGFARMFSVNTQGYDSLWSGNIKGTGGLGKAGAGTLTLTGANTYTGMTHVTGGKLVVNGSIATSAVTVERDAALGGTGTVGPTRMAGRMQPGNSVGTITVAGDYTQLPGSVLEVEIEGDGRSDQVKVTGAADIQGGRLRVQDLDAAEIGYEYSFLSAADGIKGAFETDELSRAFIGLDAFVAGSDLKLSVRRNATAFADLGKTGNQRAVARSIESQGLGAEPYDQVVVLENPADAAGIYDQLSGEIYASTQSALLDTSGVLRQAVLTRTRQGSQGAPGATGQTARTTAGSHAVWGQALGSWGQLGDSDEAQELERSVGGMIFGADTALGEHSRMGVAGGFTSSTFRGVGSSQANADGYHLALYANTKRGPWALRGGLNQSWYDVRTRRHIAYADLGSPRSEHRAQSTQLFGEVAYAIPSAAVTFEPYAGLAHVRLRSQSVDERDSVAGLHVDRSNQAVTYSTLGLRAEVNLAQRGDTHILANAGLGWRHAFGDIAPQSSMSFVSGNPYTVSGAPLARNAMVAELGISAAVGQRTRFSVSYTGQIAGSTRDHGVQARASWAF